jgi:dTDP-4-dehydrorhamnose 3,5-epimerase
MKVYPLSFDGVKLITVDRYEDQRGTFSDHWHDIKHKEIFGDVTFKQDSYVISNRGVIRGLHYQIPPHDQGKLVRCIRGSIQDVVVDLRKSSATFGHWLQVRLDGDIRHQDMLWIPPGLAHGYCVLGDRADVLYKMTQVHNPEHERTLLWNDKDLDIPWEKAKIPVLSDKDKKGTPFKEADVFD